MRVYEVKTEMNVYQSILPDIQDQEYKGFGLLDFDGRSMRETWRPPPAYILHPKLKRGDFFGFIGGGTFAMPAQSISPMLHFYERAGELLPLTVKGEEFVVLNITECIDCLDEKNSEWNIVQGFRFGPIKYAFHERRFTSPLFKIPETGRASILTYECEEDPEFEFKAAYEDLGLTGLRFKLLWEE